MDQAGRLALGRHPQRHDRPLAQRIRRAWRDPLAVLPRDRRRPDGPRSRRPARTDVRARRAADAAAGHEHGLLVRRRRRSGTPRPPVLRDVRQPRDLPPGLDRMHAAHHAVGDRADPADRRRRVGALRSRRLDPGPQHRQRESGEAGRTATTLPHRGGEVQRVAPRRPPRRALQRRPRRAGRSSSREAHSSCSGAWGDCRRTR